MADILERIAAYKREEVAVLKRETSQVDLLALARMQPAPRGFEQAIKLMTGPALIAEIKKASPSKGIIRADFDPPAIAKSYQRSGAACLSVLTDAPSFQGSPEIFADVRMAVNLPLLRKDFMVDPIQIVQSRAMGADCILIIMAMIEDALARDLFDAASGLGMDALIETHDEAELERALKLGGSLIGINNRNLRTFETSLQTFKTLASQCPPGKTLIAESGIFTSDDILELAEYGANGFLVGESLMRQDDVEGATRQLLGYQPLT